MNQASDVIAVCDLLTEQKELLGRIYHDATEPPGKVMATADLANFLFYHALNIRELAKGALILVKNREPYAVVLLARPALESAFNLVAARNNAQFGPQRIAYELEDLARKLKLLAEKNAWPSSRRPTPEECLHEAGRIRRDYHAPSPTKRSERDRIEKIERIAEVAELSPYYDDDYRQLSLSVHSNQAGILNAGSGFLVRKGMLALCNAVLLASATLCDVFHLRVPFDNEIQDHHTRLAHLMQQPDNLPQQNDSFRNPVGADDHKRPNGKP